MEHNLTRAMCEPVTYSRELVTQVNLAEAEAARLRRENAELKAELAAARAGLDRYADQGVKP
ncbi:MAG: hypothetical protein IPO08_23860 [Xanthomonadales bacterium]|nr:hypothetical protein [Xanthomonadales bacterium]